MTAWLWSLNFLAILLKSFGQNVLKILQGDVLAKQLAWYCLCCHCKFRWTEWKFFTSARRPFSHHEHEQLVLEL